MNKFILLLEIATIFVVIAAICGGFGYWIGGLTRSLFIGVLIGGSMFAGAMSLAFRGKRF